MLMSYSPGRVAQSVTCLATDASLSADPGVASSTPARSHTFVEIDHEIISTVIRERSGSVVECLTRNRRAAGSNLTDVTALCP